ncbi:MAG TPA: hypothetical protein VGY55_14765 [Pirellulales bacterium]|nr:hypothetical protein [Pirellulales bacterium]
MIGVALMAVPCAYIGWQAKIVRERKQELDRDVNGRWGFLFEGFEVVGPNPISPLRRMLGDVRIMAIEISPETELEQRAHLVALFPEADIVDESPPRPSARHAASTVTNTQSEPYPAPESSAPGARE